MTPSGCFGVAVVDATVFSAVAVNMAAVGGGVSSVRGESEVSCSHSSSDVESERRTLFFTESCTLVQFLAVSRYVEDKLLKPKKGKGGRTAGKGGSALWRWEELSRDEPSPMTLLVSLQGPTSCRSRIEGRG
jgi:hypothetical protein